MAVSVDPEDGTEGVCAGPLNDMLVPLIAADEERLPFIRQQAALIARNTGKKIIVIQLSTRTVVEEYDSHGHPVTCN